MRLLLIKNGKTKDITGYSGEYERSDNIDALGMDFTFSVAVNQEDNLFPKTMPEVGDKIQFENNGKKVFMGIIETEDWEGKYSKRFTAYDFGFYLNKSEVKVQFKNMAADAAIKKLCSQYGIPIGKISSMPTKIKKIYDGDILSDCIKDIMGQVSGDNGKQYRMEVNDNKLDIVEWKEMVVVPKFQGSSNIAPFDASKVPGSISGQRSIKEMYNYVVVYSEQEKAKGVVGEAKDMESIKKYGLMQKIETADSKNAAQARNIAKNKLTELNKVTESFSVEILGNDEVRSGRVINFDLKIPEMKGKFLVTNCTHSYTGTHKMRLELEKVG